jgi:putative DNA primase/helicase
MWNRVRRIPFTSVIPKERQDRDMRSKLATPEARAAIMAWAVRGCLEWQRLGLGSCAAVEASNRQYREAMDRGAAFIGECLNFGESARMSASSLRFSYETWCRENGVRSPLTAKELGERLQTKGAEPTRTGSERGWKGVSLAQ